MKQYNRLKKAWATISSEKANRLSNKKDTKYLIIACLFLLLGTYALFKIFF